MKQPQGSVPVEGSLNHMENSNQNSLVPCSISQDHSELVHLLDIQDRNNLAKSVLFGCEECCGPLVPIAECHVCKKTSLRKCVDCNLQIISGAHDICKNLIIFAKFSTIISHNRKDMEK